MGEERRAERLARCDLLRTLSAYGELLLMLLSVRTFGMAYTSEPRGTEDAASGVDVVRKSVMFGPLSCSLTLMSVLGALGSGTETSIGACDASSFVAVVTIASCNRAVLLCC